MRGHRLVSAGLGAVLIVAGCRGVSPPRRVASAEPGLAIPGDSASASVVAEAPPPQAVTVVDRHPILSRPRDYYENSGNNKIVKTAAATFIGIPAGIVGELKQIAVGRSPGSP